MCENIVINDIYTLLGPTINNWINVGECRATGEDKSCGPGEQQQKKSCVIGIERDCLGEYMSRTIPCSSLPICQGTY